AVDRLANGADGLCKACHVVRMRDVTGFEMHFRHAHVIACDEAVEDLGKEPPLLLVEPPGNAEIDRNDQALMVHEQVARMHVGMEKAVAQRMAQEGLDQRFGKLPEIETGGFKR